MKPFARQTGLIAATHTPFHSDGSLNLAGVEQQTAHFLRTGINTVFIGGSTGESHSLSLEERCDLAAHWLRVTRGTQLNVIVHVGSNCLRDARSLAAQAQELGALAISALAPSYFKPRGIAELIGCCREIAGGAPETPFYFYDIPSLTNVSLSMPDFLEQACDSIPNLVGLKFTNIDLMAFQQCRAAVNGRYDILWGNDETLLSAIALGAEGAVGSTYNFAAKIYHDLLAAVARNDWNAAREHQMHSVRLVQILVKRGYMASAKAFMDFLGVNVGVPRLPNASLSNEQCKQLRGELEAAGYL